MTINLRILVPDETTNFIKNPQFRYTVDGWNAGTGVTLTHSLDRARFGIASGKVVTDGTSTNQGVNYRISWLNGISDVLTASVYVRGEAKVRIRLVDGSTNTYTSETVRATDDRWTRISVTGRCSGGDDIRLYVETNDTLPQTVTFYVDGAQIERKAYPTTYCDGDQPACRWNIVNSASISTRTGDTRLGGRWIDLAGPCRGNDDLYVTVLGGMGVAPITNQIQPFALAPGSFYQGYKVQNRPVTWNFYAKQESKSPTPSINPLHELRQQLIDIIKPDKTIGSEAFLLEYSDTEGAKPLYCSFRYEAGLEGEWDIRNGWFNSFPVRMLAVDPFWYEDNQDVKSLEISQTYNSANSMAVWGRIKGIWNKLSDQNGKTLQNDVYCFKRTQDGVLYIAGSFNNDGFVYIVKWDGLNFTQLGTAANNVIKSIDIGADGTLYATGGFTAIGGVAAEKVAKYNPTTGVWSAMGAGLTGGGSPEGNAICVADNGQVYVGGQFTTAGGVACANIARWDGFQWRTVGATSGLNNLVNAICKGKDGNTIYVGGQYTASNGGSVTYNNISSVNTTTNLFSQMGYGVNGGVRAITVGIDGTIYIAGTFTAQGSPGTTSLLRVAKWIGGQWAPVGNGFDLQVFGLSYGKNGEIYACGDFSYSGSKYLNHFAKLVGNTWVPLEFYSGQSGFATRSYAIYSDGSDDIYIGQHMAAPNIINIPKLNSVNNIGTASSYPIMYVKGPGTLRYVSNIKTGQEIFLNMSILSGEEIFIDFAKGTITSTVRGSLLYNIYEGSEIRAVNLLPGYNQFAVLITNDVGAIAQLRWQTQHWSADAIVDSSPL